MIRKKRAAKLTEQARFTAAKAMVLASTEFKQRSGIGYAAHYAVDGHSVDLSQELVDQKPSLLNSDEWDVSPEAELYNPSSPANGNQAGGIIRVCWQCPEASTAFQIRNGR